MVVRKKTRTSKTRTDSASKVDASKGNPVVHKQTPHAKAAATAPAGPADDEFDAPAKVQKETPADAPPPSRERGSYDGDTAFKLYLREIGQVKLLTPAEE